MIFLPCVAAPEPAPASVHDVYADADAHDVDWLGTSMNKQWPAAEFSQDRIPLSPELPPLHPLDARHRPPTHTRAQPFTRDADGVVFPSLRRRSSSLVSTPPLIPDRSDTPSPAGYASPDEMLVTHEPHDALASAPAPAPPAAPAGAPLVWDWDTEHADRKREAAVDAAHGAQPFQVDRRVLKDVVKEHMGADVGRIQFLNAGTFNKAYLVTLADGRELVARVARRFMPRLKTASEVATMHYLRTRTTIPVPDVYHYDANPYNRLGGEYILMSRAQGVPLASVYHSLSHAQLLRLMDNTAALVVPLFAHRFPAIGSLYFGRPALAHTLSGASTASAASSVLDTPRASTADTPRAAFALATPRATSSLPAFLQTDVHVGPIVSWPFFGSARGDLRHPDEIDRGPWTTTAAYLASCARREVQGVIRENEGKSAPHRLHLDPDEIISSRHHHLKAVPGDASDESTEWDWEESECDYADAPAGDSMYSDYRRMQRTTFLVAHTKQREAAVRAEMDRWIRAMQRLGVRGGEGQGEGELPQGPEEFALDPHDMNLENVFVDPADPTKITCIIDWESTTTRPVWASAHLPAFLQSSPFTAKLFRGAVSKLALARSSAPALAHAAQAWLDAEAHGARLRQAHRCVEWDGWEDGLVAGILGPPDQEEEWFAAWAAEDAREEAREEEIVGDAPEGLLLDPALFVDAEEDAEDGEEGDADGSESPASTSGSSSSEPRSEDSGRAAAIGGARHRGPAKKALDDAALGGLATLLKRPRPDEREREKLLNATGDTCGGRGGELGRRLEAWLYNVGAVGAEGVGEAEEPAAEQEAGVKVEG